MARIAKIRFIWQSVCTKVGDFAENNDICRIYQRKRYMKRIGKLLILALATVSIAAVSCKKNDETDNTPYVSGSVKFDLPPYGRIGDKITVKPYGAYNPDGDDIYYYCTCSALKLADTIRFNKGKIEKGEASFTFTLPDSLATFMITCGAKADGYYAMTNSISITTVNPVPGGSITGNGIVFTDDHITDMRNTSIPLAECMYYYTKIGRLNWLKHNMGYYPVGEEKTFGAPYLDSEVMSYVLGRFYTFEEAQKVCPSGWRLPTDEEWRSVAQLYTGKETAWSESMIGAAGAFMADASFNGDKMWEFWPAVKITNASSLSFIPAGYAIHNDSFVKYIGQQDYAAFWTSSTTADGKAVYRYINVHQPDIMFGTADKTSFAASVRCVSEY